MAARRSELVPSPIRALLPPRPIRAGESILSGERCSAGRGNRGRKMHRAGTIAAFTGSVLASTGSNLAFTGLNLEQEGIVATTSRSNPVNARSNPVNAGSNPGEERIVAAARGSNPVKAKWHSAGGQCPLAAEERRESGHGKVQRFHCHSPTISARRCITFTTTPFRARTNQKPHDEIQCHRCAFWSPSS